MLPNLFACLLTGVRKLDGGIGQLLKHFHLLCGDSVPLQNLGHGDRRLKFGVKGPSALLRLIELCTLAYAALLVSRCYLFSLDLEDGPVSLLGKACQPQSVNDLKILLDLLA